MAACDCKGQTERQKNCVRKIGKDAVPSGWSHVAPLWLRLFRGKNDWKLLAGGEASCWEKGITDWVGLEDYEGVVGAVLAGSGREFWC